MKKIFFALFLAVAVSGATFAQSTAAKKPASATSAKVAAFKWQKTTHDFGPIPQGTPVTAEFKFTNTGNAPLIITAAQGSCGCTVADYTKEPVAPGKTGVVRATYNAANMGTFTKTVTISSNVGTTAVILEIKGEVKGASPTPAAN